MMMNGTKCGIEAMVLSAISASQQHWLPNRKAAALPSADHQISHTDKLIALIMKIAEDASCLRQPKSEWLMSGFYLHLLTLESRYLAEADIHHSLLDICCR